MLKKEYQQLIDMPLFLLQRKADKIRKKNGINEIDLCSIINAKSGKCSEDCKFCSQSAHNGAIVEEYSLKDPDIIFRAAERAKKICAGRFGIVTSGRSLNDDDVESLCVVIEKIKRDLQMDVCLSLGTLPGESLRMLKSSGATRYHHNLETSERFYPKIVTTHSFSERVYTIRNAKKAGYEVCSGGIFGLGETWQDRIDMALLLKDLGVDSVPINFLVPIKDTPLEGRASLSAAEALRIICIYRILLGDRTIKVAAGRETILENSQQDIFASGCNGILIGGYLTVGGDPIKKDHALIDEVRNLWKKNLQHS